MGPFEFAILNHSLSLLEVKSFQPLLLGEKGLLEELKCKLLSLPLLCYGKICLPSKNRKIQLKCSGSL